MTWTNWCSAYTTGGATTLSSTSTANIWYTWTVTGTTCTSTTVTVWDAWTGSGNTTAVSAFAYSPPPPETPQQQLQRKRRAGIAVARARSRALAEAAAKVRARALLVSLLDESQQAELQQHDKITVHTRKGRRFCLDAKKRSHNAYELDADGRRIREYCIVATGGVPLDDHLAAQVLMLRHEEEEFDRIANKWDLTHRARPLVR